MEADTNQNGWIEYVEWLRVSKDRKTLMVNENLKAAFDFFDKNKDGKISKDEIRRVFEEGNVLIDEEVAMSIIQQMDKNCDN